MRKVHVKVIFVERVGRITKLHVVVGRSGWRKSGAVQVRRHEAEIVVVGGEANHRRFAVAFQHRVAIEGAGFGGAAAEGIYRGVISVRPDRVLGIVGKHVAEAVRVAVVSSGRVRGSGYRDAQRVIGRVVEVRYQPTLGYLVPDYD